MSTHPHFRDGFSTQTIRKTFQIISNHPFFFFKRTRWSDGFDAKSPFITPDFHFKMSCLRKGTVWIMTKKVFIGLIVLETDKECYGRSVGIIGTNKKFWTRNSVKNKTRRCPSMAGVHFRCSFCAVKAYGHEGAFCHELFLTMFTKARYTGIQVNEKEKFRVIV